MYFIVREDLRWTRASSQTRPGERGVGRDKVEIRQGADSRWGRNEEGERVDLVRCTWPTWLVRWRLCMGIQSKATHAHTHTCALVNTPSIESFSSRSRCPTMRAVARVKSVVCWRTLESKKTAGGIEDRRSNKKERKGPWFLRRTSTVYGYAYSILGHLSLSPSIQRI